MGVEVCCCYHSVWLQANAAVMMLAAVCTEMHTGNCSDTEARMQMVVAAEGVVHYWPSDALAICYH